MTIEQSLVAEIVRSPDDPGPWLIYADWLEERGDARGELLRLTYALTRSVHLPNRTAIERRVQKSTAQGVAAPNPTMTNSLGMTFSLIPHGKFKMGGSVDVVLMATVLHDLVQAGTAEGTLREIARVLKPRGRLVIIEFDKVESEPGPPAAIRLSPGEVAEIASPYGFREEHVKAVGPTTYLVSLKSLQG